MPAVNINKTANTNNATKIVNIQKPQDAKKALIDKAEKVDIYEIAAIWISNIHQKEIVSIPVCKDGQIVGLSKLKTKWQIRFNDNIKTAKTILGGRTTDCAEKSLLFKEYVRTVCFLQFRSYEQCYVQTRKIVNALCQDPASAQQMHKIVLSAISLQFYAHAKITNMPVKPLPQSTNQTKLTYRLGDMYQTFMKHPRMIRAGIVFNHLLQFVAPASSVIDLTQEETLPTPSEHSFDTLAALASDCLSNNLELPQTPCIDLNL